ncbi:MAG: ATP-binding cassette domain-containing protein [Phycisphaerales bacterium]
MTEPAIQISNVTKRFKEKVAVNDLSLTVPEGSLCGFLGPNGAGKTTTIRMVMSIFYPDQGDIRVLGGSALDAKDRIGYLPEERGIYRKMKVLDFLTYMGQLKGVPSSKLKNHINDWLARVNLPDVQKKKCEELSKGMQQKVQFIASVIHDPHLIILDEPFSGLDPVNVRLLRELINEMHKGGKTIIFSTHVLHQAEQVCDHIFMINRGRKIIDSTVQEIRANFDPRTIVFETSDGADGQAALSAPGVDRVIDGREKGTLEAHLKQGADPQIAMRAMMASMPLRRVELRRVTLEDVFVSLVSESDSEDSARAAFRSPEAEAAEVSS